MSFYGPRRARECSFQVHDIVEVVGGRKVPVGTKGQIFWISSPLIYGQSRFATTTYKIGIKDASGKAYWTYDRNIDLVERDGQPAKHDGLCNVIWPTPELFDGADR